jgi:hypothetical protein
VAAAPGVLSALVSGTAADDDPSGSIAEIEALYGSGPNEDASTVLASDQALTLLAAQVGCRRGDLNPHVLSGH